MSTKLSAITTQYRRFTKNQVLTEGHLNEIVDFFDDQDRLSRICLSGVGIVCGFKPSCDEINNTITITQGAGVTTDGDLFHLFETDPVLQNKTIGITQKEYTHYKIYDNEKADYKPFFYDGDTQLTIYELLTATDQENDNDDTFPLADLQSNTGQVLKDAVVLLYLECYEKEKDLCVSLSCDNQGIEIIGNYKVLLVSRAIAEQISEHDATISTVNYANLFHQLPDVKANRVVLQPEDFENYLVMKQRFTERMLRNNVVSRIKFGFQTLLTALQMPILLQSIEDNIDDLFSFTDDEVPPDFQYRYDLLKDVIDTYNELKDLLFGIQDSLCCPDINSFPKHLMLGELDKDGPCYQYRHGFYKSPLLSGQNVSTCSDCLTEDPVDVIADDFTLDETVVDPQGNEIEICFTINDTKQQCFSLIKRAAQLLANYNINYNYIKVTPSNELGSLSKKAIPFYTNLGDHLIQLWDYEKTALGRYRDNVSYHDDLLNSKKPLEICRDHDFYRIEGHQGRNYKEALSIIQQTRRKHGLSFNVVVLKIKASEVGDFITNYTDFYLNKNHGYEHKAGVPPGGTFIMIYVEGEYKSYPYPYGYGYPYPYPNFPSLAGDFEDEVADDFAVLNPVVADFTLPYLCCDDNFITLSLPLDEICFDESTEPVPFHVTPMGGFVEAQVSMGLNGGVTKNIYGEYVFDPRLVSDELIGETIRFTVNNFDTDCAIRVLQKTDISIEVDTISEPTNNQVTVTFNVVSTNAVDGTIFSWNFGDNSGVIDTPQTSVQHTYNLSGPGTYNFDVVLQTGTATCSNETRERITLVIPEDPQVSIDRTTICRGDTTPHPFIIEPRDAIVTITGDGVVTMDNGFAFLATQVPDSVSIVPILVNGEASGISITIQEEPIASFTHALEEGNLVLSNTSSNANSYIWNLNGEVIERDTRSQVRRPLDQFDGSSVTVSLQAVSRLCGQNQTEPVTIPIPNTSNACIDIVTDFIANTRAEIMGLRALDVDYNDFTQNAINRLDLIITEINNNIEGFTNGDSNDLLVEIFTRESLFNLTDALNSSRTEQEQNVVRTLTERFSNAFYNILRCQDVSVIQEFIDPIIQIGNDFNQVYTQFLELQFNIDTDGSLKGFYVEITDVFTDSTSIIDLINLHLEILRQGEQF
ncbi:PKD domain-containing protein [Aquimarina brevivitae]|uniref:PKD domain-containing protein n=1 Tax=Aquimarina brevivitae TaxID=323412 RepID=A0A4Q7NYI6_9FLAO|nr:PKD domain-containing protein [Aquimarina brevivitae]RZS92506.1 hypothetical protein EV197_2644 [Aquimarina brevivitae]